MHQREEGTHKLPRMYRRQPEYVEDGKQHYADPEDDPDCKPEAPVVKQKGRRAGRVKPNRMGLVLGANMLLLGVVLYLMQTYLISNNGLLERDGMSYQVRASKGDTYFLVSLTVTQKDARSNLSGKKLVAKVSLVVQHPKTDAKPSTNPANPDDTAMSLEDSMPTAQGDSSVVQTLLEFPPDWGTYPEKDYTVRVHINAGESNIVVNLPLGTEVKNP